MAFPTSPTNGQTATVNNIAYVYASSTNTWTRQLGLFGNISTPLQSVIANATASTSTATGALIVTGGAGITGNTFVGNIISTGFYFANGAPFTSSSYGNTTVGQYLPTDSTVYGIQANIGAYQTYANTKIGTNTNSNLVVVATTTSTSTTTGALVVKGGVGVAGDTYTGGNLTVGAYSSNTRANLFVYTGVLGTASGASIVMAELNNNNGNQSYLRFITNRVAAGSNWTTSSTKIQQRIDVTDQGYIEFNPLNSNYGVDIGNGSSPTIRAFQNGNVVLPNTTASTTTATGALVVKGGVGVAGALYVGGTYSFLDGLRLSGSDTTNSVFNSGAALGLGSYGYVTLNSGVSALERVRVDASGNVAIGHISPTANLHIKKDTNAIYFEPTGNWAGKIFNATDAANEHGLVVGQRWAAAASTAFEVGSVYGGGGSAWRSYFKIDGLGGVTLSSGGSEKITMSSGTGNLTINATTTSTSTTTGALVVGGGVGVAGNVTAANIVVTTGITYSNGAAYSSGGGGGPTWAPVQTANITAVVNTAYPVDATTSNITVTLPATPAAGSQVIISDYKQALSSSKIITVYPNGGKIYGNTGNATLNNFGQSVNLTYIDSTQGWIMPFGVQVGFLTNYSITYMIVAGGGGGGSDMGGGGGAGGYTASTAYVTPGLTYAITVGGGGAGAPAGTYQVRGFNGSDSTIGRLAVTSIGGGGGGTEYGGGSYQAGAPGGSGGGAAGGTAGGGSGTSGQGYPGGAGGGSWYMGGGGGAGGAGAGGGATATGGGGVQNAILGTNYYWCGGGGGAGYSINGGPGGAGGGGGGAVGSTSGGSGINSGSPGGGGSTGSQTNTPGGNAGQYTGGGGGGGSHYNSNNYGGSGGAGIVVITYTGQRRGTGGTVTTVNGNTVHAFYSSGTFIA